MTGSVLLVVKGLDLGGIERVVSDLAIGLHRRGVCVAVALVNPRRAQFVPSLTEAGVAVHQLGGTDTVGLKGLLALRRLVRAQRPAVIHAHGPLPTLAATIVHGRTPLITTFHTTWSALRPASRSAVRLARPCAGIICVSSAVRATLPRRLRSRAVVIGHGIDPAACADAQARARAIRGPSADDAVRVVTVASHRPVKNYENLLRALAIVRRSRPDVHLFAIGDGPQLAAHRRLAASLDITDAVTFTPAIHPVLPEIARADVFVMCSDVEGQPMVLLEAMATGRPVIATSVGRAPELVTTTTGRLIPPADSERLAEAILELTGDAALRQRLGAAAASSVAEQTIERATAAHLAVYEKVTAA